MTIDANLNDQLPKLVYTIFFTVSDFIYNRTAAATTAHMHPQKTVKGFKIEYEVDFAPFQPNSKYSTATEGVRTIQISHKNDKVVNNDIEIGGSYETKQVGVADGDYHLDTDNPKKGHDITSFSDELDKIPVAPTSSSFNSGGVRR